MKKKLGNVLFFFAVMGLTIILICRNHDLGKVVRAIQNANMTWLFPAALSAFLFVFCECVIIWDLLRLLGHRTSLLQCLSYSFVGYFYSGITPSASGGQPMQLYYMHKDGNGLTDSTVVLLTVAFFSRFSLTIIGIFLLVFFNGLLTQYFQGYYFVYWLGLILNTFIAFAIFAVMVWPKMVRRVISAADRLLVHFRLLRGSAERIQKIESVVEDYKGSVQLLVRHKKKALGLFLLTLFQRATLYVLTWFVFRSFIPRGGSFWTVVLLQAAIYVSVEMLPLPGSQGISELLYRSVFAPVFHASLTPSMLVVRGLDFYLLMLVGMIFSVVRFFRTKKRAGSAGAPQAEDGPSAAG